MELRQLERFLAVADLGSLAEVARREGLTQQGISASLAALERELGGVRLFDRSPGGVTRLTDIGHALLPHARAQLAADQRARRDIASLASARSGTVTLGIGETFAGDVVAGVVTEILADRPDLRINLVEGYSEGLLPRLYAGEFDFLAAGVSNMTLPAGFEARVIYSANDIVVCRPGHPLAGRRGLKVADLEGYSWLVPYARPADIGVITEAFVTAGIPPPVRFTGSDAFRIGVQLMAATNLLLMTSPAVLRGTVVSDPYAVEVLDVPAPTVVRNASLI
ncbi:MAG: LysR family transcriptional regulator, partial [Chromatocurvus sp.]